MYVCVRARVCVFMCMCVCVRKTFKRKEKRENSKEWRRENINLLIQINRQTDGQIDRHKSFIDMRYNTEQYSKSNSIE